MACTDVAMCCLYLQIFLNKHYLWCIYIGMGLIVLGYLAIGISVLMIWIIPLAEYHNQRVYITTAVVEIVSNVIIVLLPMPGLWKLKKSRRERIYLILGCSLRVVYVPRHSFLIMLTLFRLIIMPALRLASLRTISDPPPILGIESVLV